MREHRGNAYLEQPREIPQVEQTVKLVGGGEEVLEHPVMEGYSRSHHCWTTAHHSRAEWQPLQVEAQDRAKHGAEGLTAGCADRQHCEMPLMKKGDFHITL